MQFTQYEFDAKQARLEELKAKSNYLRKSYSHAIDSENDSSMSSSAARSIRLDIDVVESQIKALTAEISSAEVVKEIAHSETVDYGATVKARFFYPEGPEDEVLIVSNDTSYISKGMIVCTPSSPLFKFLKGKEKGYHGTFKEEIQGNTVSYDFEILEVNY